LLEVYRIFVAMDAEVGLCWIVLQDQFEMFFRHCLLDHRNLQFAVLEDYHLIDQQYP